MRYFVIETQTRPIDQSLTFHGKSSACVNSVYRAPSCMGRAKANKKPPTPSPLPMRPHITNPPPPPPPLLLDPPLMAMIVQGVWLSQDIDKDACTSCDEHYICLHFKVSVDDSLDGLIEQYTSDHPDDQHRHQSPYHLCRGGDTKKNGVDNNATVNLSTTKATKQLIPKWTSMHMDSILTPKASENTA